MENQIALIDSPYKLLIQSTLTPDTVATDRILLKTKYSLISPGTELGAWTGKYPPRKNSIYPYYPGYSAVGKSILIGDSLTSKFRVGERLFFPGKHAYYSEIYNADTSCIPINDSVGDEIIPFMRISQIAYAAIDATSFLELEKKDILVVGLGLIGNLAGQWMLTKKARVFGFDHNQFRADIAKKCGFTDAYADHSHKEVGKYDIVICASGNSDSLSESIDYAKDKGCVVVLGSPKSPIMFDFYSKLHARGLIIVGAHERRLDQQMKFHSLTLSLRHFVSGDFLISPLITKIISLNELGRAYDLLENSKNDHLGILIEFP